MNAISVSSPVVGEEGSLVVVIVLSFDTVITVVHRNMWRNEAKGSQLSQIHLKTTSTVL